MMPRMPMPESVWTARQPPAPHSLVLFVGSGARPGAELADGLARAGIRGLWLARIDQALAAAAHARFDAAVIQLDASVASAARQFDVWRRALACPLLLLAETLGSCGAAFCVPEGYRTVGLDINANHLKGATSGWVTGTTRPVHIGRTTQVWHIDLKNDAGELTCVSRITMAVLAPR